LKKHDGASRFHTGESVPSSPYSENPRCKPLPNDFLLLVWTSTKSANL
jgi:hypothetical protein